MAIEALQFVLTAAEEVEQQAQRSSRLVGSAVLTVDIVREKHCLDLFGFVVSVEKFAQAPCQEGYELTDLVRSDAAKSAPDAK